MLGLELKHKDDCGLNTMVLQYIHIETLPSSLPYSLFVPNHAHHTSHSHSSELLHSAKNKTLKTKLIHSRTGYMYILVIYIALQGCTQDFRKGGLEIVKSLF